MGNSCFRLQCNDRNVHQWQQHTPRIRYPAQGLVQQVFASSGRFPSYFSETEDMKVKSSSVGTACMQSSPVISFTFDGHYTTDTLSGWLQQDEKAISPAEVHNIYEEKPSNYMYLADISACRKYNPLESPMWNKEVSKTSRGSRFYQSRPQSPTRLALPSRQDNSRSKWLDIQWRIIKTEQQFRSAAIHIRLLLILCRLSYRLS